MHVAIIHFIITVIDEKSPFKEGLEPLLSCSETDTIVVQCEAKDANSKVKWLRNNKPICEKEER